MVCVSVEGGQRRAEPGLDFLMGAGSRWPLWYILMDDDLEDEHGQPSSVSN